MSYPVRIDSTQTISQAPSASGSDPILYSYRETARQVFALASFLPFDVFIAPWVYGILYPTLCCILPLSFGRLAAYRIGHRLLHRTRRYMYYGIICLCLSDRCLALRMAPLAPFFLTTTTARHHLTAPGVLAEQIPAKQPAAHLRKAWAYRAVTAFSSLPNRAFFGRGYIAGGIYKLAELCIGHLSGVDPETRH